MDIIGINGFKRSGKGETALAIESLMFRQNKVALGVGFADKLKIMAALSLGFDRPHKDLIDLMDEAKEKWTITVDKRLRELDCKTTAWHDLTGREYLQNFGNEARNLFGDTFWIDQVLPLDRPLEYDADCLCITDLRYPNEAERVRALGGKIIQVLRPGTASDGHASEQPLPLHLIDATINNDGGLQDLEWKVEKVLESFGVLA